MFNRYPNVEVRRILLNQYPATRFYRYPPIIIPEVQHVVLYFRTKHTLSG
jgi:hypothetical protein